MKPTSLPAMLEGVEHGTVTQRQLNDAFTLEDILFFRRRQEKGQELEEMLYTRWRHNDTWRLAAHWVPIHRLRPLQQYNQWLAAHDLHHLYETMRQYQLGSNGLVMRSVHRTCHPPGKGVHDHYHMGRRRAPTRPEALPNQAPGPT